MEVHKEQELHTAGGIGIEQDCGNTETSMEINGDDRKAIICEAYNRGFFGI